MADRRGHSKEFNGSTVSNIQYPFNQTDHPATVTIATTAQADHTNRDIAIILGSFFGALIFVLAFFILLFLIFKRKIPIRKDFSMRRFKMGNTAEIDMVKNDPAVLLLYSYDCAAHEKAVMVLATYLKEVCQLEVHLDIWDQNIIQEQGILTWITNKLDIVQFVVIVCSTGARFKCARNQGNYRVVQDRPGKFESDVFQNAISVVIDKMHAAKSGNGNLQNFLIVYFDYSSINDIPPKLDSAPTFCLTKDISRFEQHLRRRLDDKTSTLSSRTSTISTRTHRSERSFDSHYKRIIQSGIGQDLIKAVEEAKAFFKKHPDWLGEILEPTHIDRTLTATTTLPSSSPTNSLSPSTEDEKLLTERKRKREKGTLNALEIVSPVDSGRATMSPEKTNGTAKFIENDIMEDDDLLQRDVDFIRNLDKNTPPPWKKPNTKSFEPLVLNASRFAPLARLDPETPLGDRIIHLKVDSSGQAVLESPSTPTVHDTNNIKLEPPPSSPHRRFEGRGVVV